ncbi:MAG TPA: hypothetical protein PKD54_07740 [Pirellulaceae bacterium]|nr:hypothetical protein [Pirellulaceae bacterium]
MHDLGPSQLEQTNMHPESFAQQEYFEGGLSYESPLEEAIANETGYYESPLQEGGFYEAPYQENPYQEAPYQEAGYAPINAGAGEFIGEGEYFEGEHAHEYFETTDEEDEMALAAELLEVQSDAEMDQFLGKLVRRAVRGAGRFLRTPAGRIVGGILRNVARRALPIAGTALGTFVGGPAGGAIGGKLATAAGQALGLETAGMTEEEANFVTGRQFVRFAMNAARNAAAAAPNQNPQAIAAQSVRLAAQRFAPGLLGTPARRISLPPITGRRRGVWVRRGNLIVIYGA